jgi:hypothetical protein
MCIFWIVLLLYSLSDMNDTELTISRLLMLGVVCTAYLNAVVLNEAQEQHKYYFILLDERLSAVRLLHAL